MPLGIDPDRRFRPQTIPGAFTLQMVMSGPLGTRTEMRVLNAIVAKGAGPPQIQDVSVKPVVAQTRADG